MWEDEDEGPMTEAEREARLTVIKARIRASIEDPRPSFTIDEVEAHLDRVATELSAQEDAAA